MTVWRKETHRGERATIVNPLLSFGSFVTAIQVGSIVERRSEQLPKPQARDGLHYSRRGPPLVWHLEKNGKAAALFSVEALLNHFLSK